MRVLVHARTTIHPRMRLRAGWRSPVVAIVGAFLLLLSMQVGVDAQESSSSPAHSLGVTLAFPDDGLSSDEQLCVALFSGTSPDLTQPPLLSRCLDPGNTFVSFRTRCTCRTLPELFRINGRVLDALALPRVGNVDASVLRLNHRRIREL